MKQLFAACIALVLGATFAMAEDQPVVVELYTSQGCSSCPPADEMMHALAERDDVIALALHVDYWDYIGWKDEFAHPRNAERQRAYATVAGRRTIYTPEMIVNGMTDIVGAKPMEVSKAIAEHKSQPKRIDLSVTRSGETVTIAATVLSNIDGPMVVQMLRYQPLRTTRITRGENSGKTINYANVTEDWQVLGEWTGTDPLSMTAQAKGGAPVVVLIQVARHGPIIAAGLVE